MGAILASGIDPVGMTQDNPVWNIIFVLVSCIALAWRVRASGRHVLLRLCGTARDSFKATARWLLYVSPAHPLHRQMTDVANKRVVDSVSKMCPMIMVIATCWSVLQLFLGSPSRHLGYELFPGFPIISRVLILFWLFPLVGTIQPRWITPGVPYVYRVLYYVLILFSLAATGLPRDRTVEAFVISIFHAKTRFTLYLECVYLAAARPWLQPADFQRECALSLLIFTATFIYQRARDAEILATLEAKTSRNYETTADGLLSSMCDAVVHLSKDLQLSKPSTHLAALLLRSPNTINAGVHFVDLAFNDGEKDRLVQFLERSIGDAATTHMSLKDSWGMAVRVQLFHARGIGTHDEVTHVLGVREDSEGPRAPPESELRDSPAIPPRGTFETISEDRSSLSGSSSSARMVDIPRAGMGLYIDPDTYGLRILQCTTEFKQISGPECEGKYLLKWVINTSDFMDWADETYNKLSDAYESCDGDVDEEPEVQPFRIRLQLPHMGPRVTEVSASAHMVLEAPERGEGGGAPAPRVLLMLDDLTLVQMSSSSAQDCQLRGWLSARRGALEARHRRRQASILSI